MSPLKSWIVEKPKPSGRCSTRCWSGVRRGAARDHLGSRPCSSPAVTGPVRHLQARQLVPKRKGRTAPAPGERVCLHRWGSGCHCCCHLVKDRTLLGCCWHPRRSDTRRSWRSALDRSPQRAPSTGPSVVWLPARLDLQERRSVFRYRRRATKATARFEASAPASSTSRPATTSGPSPARPPASPRTSPPTSLRGLPSRWWS